MVDTLYPNQLITLPGIVEASEQRAKKIRLSGDGKMVPIPLGAFIYQDGEEKANDHDYEIDVYPVTNQTYEKFIRAGGYADNALWDDAGWKWREKQNIDLPGYWDNKDYNDPDSRLWVSAFLRHRPMPAG